jgi:CYTH domain-containing protein
MKDVEIERKWLVKERPATDGLDNAFITQGYAITAKKACLRIRTVEQEGNFIGIITAKGPSEVEGGVFEKEMEIPLELAMTLLNEQSQVITKTRYYVPNHNSYDIELDVFHGRLAGLVVAEVEFDNPEDSLNFIPPTWFGREVTSDKRYSNANLVTLMEVPEEL